MKSLLIETVSNGWIVRPFQPCDNWVSTERPEIAVFTKIEDLQAAIPELLTYQIAADSIGSIKYDSQCCERELKP